MKMNTKHYHNLWDTAKIVHRREFIAPNIHIRVERNKSQRQKGKMEGKERKDFSFHLKKLNKVEQINPK